MKGMACLVFALVAVECTNAQDYSRVDSLSILFQVFNMSEFEKGLFNGTGARDTSIYIYYVQRSWKRFRCSCAHS
jgi:hypothetical protein